MQRGAMNAEMNPGADETHAGRPISLLELWVFGLREWRLLLGVPLALLLLTGVVGLLLPRHYTVGASFLPQSSNPSAGRLAGLAAQFGVSLPMSEPATLTPQFYGELLRSTQTLREAAAASYQLDSGPAEPLVDIWRAKGKTPGLRLNAAIRRLRKALKVSVDQETGLVKFSVRTRNPELSTGLAERFLVSVDSFNIANRQRMAEAEREFMDERVRQLRVELDAAEGALQAFLERNREVSGSSRLLFERERLQREADFRRQMYLGVAQAYERARLESLRNTPVIALVERPRVPVEPDRRYLIVKGLLAAIAGFIVATVIGAGRAYLRLERAQRPAVAAEAERLWRELRRR
jgi:uncharacterized protein involved in exopolysaccharide biosynthesis